jgi:hypothetical protein
MQTCVPVEKRSKKAQRAAVRANRVLWQGVKLCPRIMRKKTDYKGRRAEVMDE